jgi:hypothetical protein
LLEPCLNFPQIALMLRDLRIRELDAFSIASRFEFSLWVQRIASF